MHPDQFASALYKGLGRPILQAKTAYHQDYFPIILDACLYGYRYDRMCEGSRASYLLELIDQTPDQDRFAEQILAAFSNTLTNESENLDGEQLCDFMLYYSQNGCSQAQSLLEEQAVASLKEGVYLGISQFIQFRNVDGVRALLQEAEHSKLFNTDISFLLGELKNLAPTSYDQTLHDLRRESAFLQQMLLREEQRTKSYQRSPLPQTYSELDGLIKSAQHLSYGVYIPFISTVYIRH